MFDWGAPKSSFDMVNRIVWLPVAQRNLKSIYKFISKKSVRAAIKIHNKILDAVEPLLYFPQMAPIESLLEDRDKVYRALVVDKYKIVYYVENNIIYIAAVWDCRQIQKNSRNESIIEILLRKNVSL